MSALLSEARAIRRSLFDQWDAHVRICGQCKSLAGDDRRFCDDGWELAKQLQAARARVAELQDAMTEGHATLL